MATNIKGDSSLSAIGTGATIITKSNAPTNLAEDSAQRTATSLGLTWSAAAFNGGASVTEFRINIAE